MVNGLTLCQPLSLVSSAMNQCKFVNWQKYHLIQSMALLLGNVLNVRPSMDDKEKLLIFLVLLLFIGGVAMGYMAHG